MVILEFKRKPGRMCILAAATLCLTAPALAIDAAPGLPPADVGTMLSRPVTATDARIHVAQTQEAAQMAVRIQQLEEQMRALNGQIEGLTFQMTQMQTLIQRMQEDNEFRFQQLEGGAPGKPDAATQSGGETPSGVLPQGESDVAPTIIPEQGVVPLPGEQEFDPTFDDGTVPPSDDQGMTGGEGVVTGVQDPQASETGDGVGASADPLLGTGAGQIGAVLGELPVEPALPGTQPLDLTFSPGMDTGDPDADAQFAAAYEAVQRGDLDFAEDQFGQFIELYPDNRQAPDAGNWLGEALLARGANEEAAEVLLNAYQAAPESPRAPDLLLRLGIALSRAGERETACRTFEEIPARFANITTAFRTRLDTERASAQCPPA